VIAVHVGDEDAANLGGFDVAAEELVLSAFAAVKEPNFSPLGES
jgi:hypothetical protein